MKKGKNFRLRTLTDIKVFLLFLLEKIAYPIDKTTLIRIIAENTYMLSFEYDVAFSELVDDGHLYSDTVDGETDYMISKSGRMIASELYDTLDPAFREKSLNAAAKYLSLAKREADIRSSVTELPNHRFAVQMIVSDATGELMNTTLTFSSAAEAEEVRRNFEARPDDIYRAFLFATTQKIAYLR